jgi:glucosamine-6-phosphate deaminase
MTINIIKVNNQEEGATIVFNLYKNALENGAKTFGLATGSSPIALYNKLISSNLDFSNATSINLDEYVDLDINNEQSYHYFMNQHLFSKKIFLKSYIPDGNASDLQKSSNDYDQVILENPIDLQLLGIGINGHIGFNEPGTSFDSLTHIVDLTKSTIDANTRFFESKDDVPTKAISMGIASIMSAKKIVLLAYGENKADAIYKTVKGEIAEEVPASVLQKHSDVTLIVDEAAASKL